MTGPAIAVTGATGHIGGAVARSLADRGVAQRLLVRDPARAPRLERAQLWACSYTDGAAAREALTGVDTLFMVSAAESAERLGVHRSLIDAARDAGVRHIVYTSFLGAAPDAVFTLARDHFATERHIAASGRAWTFLRDNFYLDVFEDFVGEGGVLRGPAGDGRVSAVARADVAAVAVEVLREPLAHAGASYDLTGPRALSLDEIAAAIGEARGRPVRYRPETLREAWASRAGYGAPDWQVAAWVSTYTAIASGELAVVSEDVRRITGRAPRSLADVLAGR